MLFAFRVMIKKDIDKTLKGYFKLLLKAFIPIVLAFIMMGLISTHAPIGVMLLISALSPFLIMWSLPTAITNDSVVKGLKYGITKSWKSFGNGLGLFFAIAGTLIFVYTFIGVPLDMIKDMPINWFVLPLSLIHI